MSVGSWDGRTGQTGTRRGEGDGVSHVIRFLPLSVSYLIFFFDQTSQAMSVEDKGAEHEQVREMAWHRRRQHLSGKLL